MIKERPQVDAQPEAPVRKFTLKERAQKLGKEKILKELNERAREIEEWLHRAYPLVSEAAIGSMFDDDVRMSPDIEGAMPSVRRMLIELAHDVRQLSVQYRDFAVGGVILAVRKTDKPHENPWVIMFNANTKPENEPKWCAELYLLDEIEARSDIERIITMVTVGKAQRDDDSQTDQVTLSPCVICRDRIHALAQDETATYINEDTEIYTMRTEHKEWRPDEKLVHPKYFKAGGLHRFHEEKNGYEEL